MLLAHAATVRSQLITKEIATRDVQADTKEKKKVPRCSSTFEFCLPIFEIPRDRQTSDEASLLYICIKLYAFRVGVAR